MKRKTDKLYFSKINNFRASKDAIKKVKKVTYRIGENNCKSLRELYLEGIRTHMIHNKKVNNPINK